MSYINNVNSSIQIIRKRAQERLALFSYMNAIHKNEPDLFSWAGTLCH